MVNNAEGAKEVKKSGTMSDWLKWASIAFWPTVLFWANAKGAIRRATVRERAYMIETRWW